MSDTWVGNGSGTNLWDQGGNWSPSVVPSVSSANVAIAENGSYNVEILASDPAYTIRSLSLGGFGSSPTLTALGQINVQKSVSMSSGTALDIGTSGSISSSRISVATGASILDLGSMNVSGTLAGSGSVTVNGAELFTNNIAGINTYTLFNAATMTISNSVSSSGAIVFGDGLGDTLNLDTAGSSFGAAISGFGGSDVIDLGSLAYSSNYTISYSNSELSISNGSATLFTFTDVENPGVASLQDDGAGGTEIVTCFLQGMSILTPCGEVPVETLSPGDLVATLIDGAVNFKAVKWVGKGRLNPRLPKKGHIRPVRIQAGAFEESIPSRDLLVTPEHCIYVNGNLIPARMLVNGRSIVEESFPEGFSYYHVELQEHAILLAHGLATESYLDTGNRGKFSNAHVVNIRPNIQVDVHQRSWTSDACAPLATDRETVEPVWRVLDKRAEQSGIKDQRTSRLRVDNPQLHLVLESGKQIFPRWISAEDYLFQIPVGQKAVCVRSLVSSAADSIGPFMDDRRELGVRVRSIVLWNGLQDTKFDAKDLDQAGWHDMDGDARWTSGEAMLDLPTATTIDTFVSIHVAGFMTYSSECQRQALAG